jgi:ERCC4-related helicase
MFYQCLLAIAGGSRGGKGKPSKAGKKSIRDNPEFRKILDQVEGVMNDKNRSKASQHPKLEKARDLVSHRFLLI